MLCLKMRLPLCFLLALTQMVVGAPLSDKRYEDTATYLPFPDPNVDRNSFAHLAPTWTPVLTAQEPSGRGQYLSIALEPVYPLIILENSAHITDYQCGFPKTPGFAKTPAITVQFDSAEALTFALGWPRKGLVLVTNHQGCNSGAERGVYLTRKAVFDRSGLKATFFVQPTELKDVATTITIHSAGNAIVGAKRKEGSGEEIRSKRLPEAELKKRSILS